MATGSIHKLTEYLFDDTCVFPQTSVGANTVADISKDVGKTGYTLIACIPMTTQNVNAVWLGLKPVSDGKTANGTIRNLSSSSISVTAKFTAIYKKN